MAGEANRISAFNSCNPFDTVLPISDGTLAATDRQHLWGLYAGITTSILITDLRLSAFNFCNPFDHILPVPTTPGAESRRHLWGLYSGIATDAPAPTGTGVWNYPIYCRRGKRRR